MPAVRADIGTIVVGVGYTGQRVLERCPTESCVGLSRTHKDMDFGPPVHQFDLDKAAAVPIELRSNYNIVYTVPPDHRRMSDSRLRRMLELVSPPPARFVYLSTSGVYGNRDGAVVDETSTPAPQSKRAKRRLAAERDLSRWSEHNETVLVVLRVPGIYGPGRLGINRIRQSRPVLTDKDADPGNRIHVDDLASCAIAALKSSVPAGIYNVGDGDTRSASWFAFEVARQCGLAPPPRIGREQALLQFSLKRRSFLNESRRLDLTKMHEILEPDLQYTDAADGIAASLREEPA